jgi:hypothetical protein
MQEGHIPNPKKIKMSEAIRKSEGGQEEMGEKLNTNEGHLRWRTNGRWMIRGCCFHGREGLVPNSGEKESEPPGGDKKERLHAA